MQIVVVGAGAVGLYITNYLVNAGSKVILIGRIDPGRLKNNILTKDLDQKKFKYIPRNTVGVGAVKRMSKGLDAIVIAEQDDVESPYQQGIAAYTRLLEEFKHEGFKGKVILVSSDRVYGDTEGIIAESIFENPNDFTGLYELSREQGLRRTFTKNFIIIRCAEIFGMGIGGTIHDYIEKSLKGEKIIVPKGNRDFTYIYNLTDFIGFLLNPKLKGKYVVNFGNGQPTTFSGLAYGISTLCGGATKTGLIPASEVEINESLPGEQTVMDYRELKELKFEPSVVHHVDAIRKILPFQVAVMDGLNDEQRKTLTEKVTFVI